MGIRLRKAKGVTAYEVLADSAEPGPAADYTKVFRFRTLEDAVVFAAKSTLYGNPAEVKVSENVPRHIAERWGLL